MKRIMIVLVVVAITAGNVYAFLMGESDVFSEEASDVASIPVETALEIVAAENAKIRKLWTGQIVGPGKKAGLAFDEEWRSDTVDAGPLPALFLREMATYLHRTDVPLNLFLGSEFPISDANKFSGEQLEVFRKIEETHEPQYFYAKDTQLNVAMFEDVAVAEACVTCHNEHPQTPKSDWVLNDIMGATTWMYPDSEVSAAELMQIITAVREAAAHAYGEYILEIEAFDTPPEIGERWPSEGYFVPSTEVFMAEVGELVSAETLNAIIETAGFEREAERLAAASEEK